MLLSTGRGDLLPDAGRAMLCEDDAHKMSAYGHDGKRRHGVREQEWRRNTSSVNRQSGLFQLAWKRVNRCERCNYLVLVPPICVPASLAGVRCVVRSVQVKYNATAWRGQGENQRFQPLNAQDC